MDGNVNKIEQIEFEKIPQDYLPASETVTYGELVKQAAAYPGHVEMGFSDERGFESMIYLEQLIVCNGVLFLTGRSSYKNSSDRSIKFREAKEKTITYTGRYASDTDAILSIKIDDNTPVYMATRPLDDICKIYSKLGEHQISNITSLGPQVLTSLGFEDKSLQKHRIVEGVFSIWSAI